IMWRHRQGRGPTTIASSILRAYGARGSGSRALAPTGQRPPCSRFSGRPLIVPPHSEMTVTGTQYTTDISVPFTETGTITYQSGESISGTFTGIYEGTGSYNITTTYSVRVPWPPTAAGSQGIANGV